MGANQIANMVMKIFMRKMISKGIDAGMGVVSKKTAGNQTVENGGNGMLEQDTPQKRQLTPEERQRQKEVRKARRAARQAKQSMKVTKRVTRM